MLCRPSLFPLWSWAPNVRAREREGLLLGSASATLCQMKGGARDERDDVVYLFAPFAFAEALKSLFCEISKSRALGEK